MVTAQQPTTDASIPQISCPQCGDVMRLAMIRPEDADNHSCLFFDCGCGFRYQMSERAKRGR
jgi:DNA-directed RNA polymerase subunit M/transcription elongation factor TFIIS